MSLRLSYALCDSLKHIETSEASRVRIGGVGAGRWDGVSGTGILDLLGVTHAWLTFAVLNRVAPF